MIYTYMQNQVRSSRCHYLHLHHTSSIHLPSCHSAVRATRMIAVAAMSSRFLSALRPHPHKNADRGQHTDIFSARGAMAALSVQASWPFPRECHHKEHAVLLLPSLGLICCISDMCVCGTVLQMNYAAFSSKESGHGQQSLEMEKWDVQDNSVNNN